MSHRFSRRRRALAAGVLAALTMIGCGQGDGSSGDGSPSGPIVDPAADPPLVSTLEIDPATRDFLLTTNAGFYRIARASGRVTEVRPTVNAEGRVADLGPWVELAAGADGRLVGSGHPAATGTVPELLGVIASEDGGRSWRVLSRLGKSDLHKIVLKHDRMYAIDSPIGALIVSRDGGRTFSEQFTPTGVLIADFEVDPGDPRRIVVAGDAEVFRSVDGGARWERIGEGSGSRLAWPARDALYRALKDGSVQRSADDGTSWKTVGRVDGEPYRMKAVSRDELYLVTGEATILHTRDGGRSWEEAFRP